MDLQTTTSSLQGMSSLAGLVEYLIETFFPTLVPLFSRYPRSFGVLSSFVAVWWVIFEMGLWCNIWNEASSFLVSTVQVSSRDDIYTYILKWAAEHRSFRFELVANATTPHDGVSGTVNENVRLEPAEGLQIFIFRKCVLTMRNTITSESHGNEGTISLSCLGRSLQPQKELLEEIYRLQKEKEHPSTLIRRPEASQRLRTWQCVARKPKRPMDSVALEAGKSDEILKDIAEYLLPATRDLYVSRGIPYRRGYLFHGPPGTGKTR